MLSSQPYHITNTYTCLLKAILILLLFQTTSPDIYAQPNAPRAIFTNYKPVNVPVTRNTDHTQAYFKIKALNNPLLPGIDAGISEQNLLVMQHSGQQIPGQTATARTNQIKELRQAFEEEKNSAHKESIHHFQSYLNQLLQLDPNNFSITRAVYLTEAVYYDKPYSFDEFEKAVKQRADFVKQIIQQERLSIKNNIAIHYGIQKLFSQNNIIKDQKTGKSFVIKRPGYDFDDFYGEKDWTNLFVTKLLESNSGQCHSLPLLYLCIAEQLQAKAWLSLAPNHSFIQFADNVNRLHNFETTNGHLVTTAWLMQGDAINATAYKNKTYLDTLSSKKLFAQCLADLQMAYLMKNGYDHFSQQLSQQILLIDSANMNALMVNANHAAFIYFNRLKAAGNPPREQYNNYPELLAAYNNMAAAQQKVNKTGYQDMPEKQYKEWLRSIEIEKQKKRHQDEQERMNREIEKLKKIRSTFINKPKT